MRDGLRRIFAGVFREREILLRSNGRVRFLHLTPRLQVFLAILIGVALFWGTGGTYLSWRGYESIKAHDGQMADAQAAFDGLLEEIAIYRRKVTAVTGKLRRNQSDLVRQFAWADALEAEVVAAQDPAPVKQGRLAAIAEARRAMDRHVRQLQGDLRLMTDLDTALKSTLNIMQSDLFDAAADREKGYRARAVLSDEVKRLTQALGASRATVAALRGQTDALDSRLTQSRAQIQREAAARKALQAQIATLQPSLEAEVRRGVELKSRTARSRTALDTARRDYERISQLRAALDVEVAGLGGALKAEADRGNALEADLRKFAGRLSQETGVSDSFNPAKESLSTRIAALLDRLTMLHRDRATVLETLRTRNMGSLDEAERILGMTGLNIETVLVKVSGSQTLDEGGPFIAASPGRAEMTGFAKKVSGLKAQLNRLGALQTALRAMPLAAPLDGYRLASGFGRRRDPISRRWARHEGVDLSARLRSAVRATAPGIVTLAAWNGRYGRMVEIDHGYGIRTRYGHLRKILVKKGQRITHRQKIALVGNSGRSTGPHLHYEIFTGTIAMDPMRFIKAGQYVFKE
jgi:murein DD-endopeptidase MepM/ murein hydrolase activator NlpD